MKNIKQAEFGRREIEIAEQGKWDAFLRLQVILGCLVGFLLLPKSSPCEVQCVGDFFTPFLLKTGKLLWDFVGRKGVTGLRRVAPTNQLLKGYSVLKCLLLKSVEKMKSIK